MKKCDCKTKILIFCREIAIAKTRILIFHREWVNNIISAKLIKDSSIIFILKIYKFIQTILMAQFKVIFTNITLTISQYIQFIIPTFRVSCITYTAQQPHIMFLLFYFFDCILLVLKCRLIFLVNIFSIFYNNF